MGNIKQRLEAEADRIVDTHRESGEGVHDLIAKHASLKGYGEEHVRSLTQLVNRAHFKKAMALDKRDEMDIADAESVLRKMTMPKAASQSPALSKGIGIAPIGRDLGGQAMSKHATTDFGPVVRAKLANEFKGIDSERKGLRADMRKKLAHMAKLAECVKRTGVEDTPLFKSAVAKIPARERSLMEAVMTEVPTQKVAFTEGQLRMFIPQAIAATSDMWKLASAILDVSDRAATIEARQSVITGHLGDLKNGLEI